MSTDTIPMTAGGIVVRNFFVSEGLGRDPGEILPGIKGANLTPLVQQGYAMAVDKNTVRTAKRCKEVIEQAPDPDSEDENAVKDVVCERLFEDDAALANHIEKVHRRDPDAPTGPMGRVPTEGASDIEGSSADAHQVLPPDAAERQATAGLEESEGEHGDEAPVVP